MIKFFSQNEFSDEEYSYYLEEIQNICQRISTADYFGVVYAEISDSNKKAGL